MSNNDWSGEVEEVPELAITNEEITRLLAHNNCMRDEWLSIWAIKYSLIHNRLDEAKEAWGELTEEEQTAIWIAPSKGGIFTTKERSIIKSGFKEQQQ
jgi:recombination protein RecT